MYTHRKLDCIMARSDRWAGYALKGCFTMGKIGNTTAEQINSVFTRSMDGYEYVHVPSLY